MRALFSEGAEVVYAAGVDSPDGLPSFPPSDHPVDMFPAPGQDLADSVRQVAHVFPDALVFVIGRALASPFPDFYTSDPDTAFKAWSFL